MTIAEAGLRRGELVFVGCGAGRSPHADHAGAIRDAVGTALGALAALAADPEDLVAIRLFYVDDAAVEESGLLEALAYAMGPQSHVAITLVPVAHLTGRRLVELEAIAMRGADGLRPPRTHVPGNRALPDRFAAAVCCGELAFLSAQSAPGPRTLPEQSVAVMGRLGEVLATLGADFRDVVKMNRWYAALGTQEAWEPSARAVARHFTEPGPVATAISLPERFRDGALIRIELLAMRGRQGGRLTRGHAWPAGHWDWPIHLPYKHGLACGPMAFVGGQVSLDEHAQVIAPDNLEAQTGQALRNIGRVLAELGMAPTDLVKLSAFFADKPVDASAGGSIARLIRRFAGADPVVTCVPLPYLSYPEMRVEIEAIAWRDRDPPRSRTPGGGQTT